ncbi:MAG: aldo/keto reductase [Vicinamibacterales bacterium]
MGVGGHPGALSRPRRQLHRHGQRLHPAGIPKSSSATPGAVCPRDPGRAGDQVPLQPLPRRSNGGGAGRRSLQATCEQSLRRLRTDYLDLYWMHCWDAHTPIEETMRALDDLVRAGKVRYIGFSDTPAWKVAR